MSMGTSTDLQEIENGLRADGTNREPEHPAGEHQPDAEGRDERSPGRYKRQHRAADHEGEARVGGGDRKEVPRADHSHREYHPGEVSYGLLHEEITEVHPPERSGGCTDRFQHGEVADS